MDNTIQKLSEFHAIAKGAKKFVVEYILANVDDVVFMNLENIAEKIGISPSTITRTASAIGFAGFPDLQENLRKFVRSTRTPTERLESLTFKEGSLGIHESFAVDEANVQRTLSMNSDLIIEKAIDELIKARRVYLLATRSSYGVLSFMSVILAQIRPDVIMLEENYGNMVEHLLDITAEDLILALSLPRYSKVVVDVLQGARKSGCRILSISDQPSSLLASLSDTSLFVPYESSSFFNSTVSSMALVNAILTGVNTKLGKKALERLQRHNDLLKQTKGISWKVESV